MSIKDGVFKSINQRHAAIDEARAAGRLGSTRVPLSLVADPSLSDTCIRRLPGAVEVGREQRTANDEYLLWLTINAERLSLEVSESGATDGCAWLRQQYTIETGKQP